MSRVIVIGGSDQGRQVIDAIISRGVYSAVGVLDRALTRGDTVAGVPVLGGDDELAAHASEVDADAFVVAIGDNSTRGRILEREHDANPRLRALPIVHPAAVVAHDATLGAGAILLAGAVVGNGTAIGRGVLLGTNSSVDHDGYVGDYASLGPGATTGGTVRIGRGSAIGLGANVVHGVAIGDDTVIGAGALVLGDVPSRVVAFGVPAVVQRSRRPDEPYLRRQ